jgi:polyisoprenoid-binding protein YceI
MTLRSFRAFLPAFALVLALVPASAADVDTYQIDAVHSNIGFKVRHLVSKVTGRFGGVQGKVLFDTKDVTKSSVDVTIDVNTIATGNDGRDAHLKNPDFFEVAKYPTITFKSSAVKEVAKGQLEVTGTFTMHGVSKVITIPVTNLGTAPGMKPGSLVAGFEGSLTINRSDYGMKTMIGPLGDEVAISLNIEAGRVNN